MAFKKSTTPEQDAAVIKDYLELPDNRIKALCDKHKIGRHTIHRIIDDHLESKRKKIWK